MAPILGSEQGAPIQSDGLYSRDVIPSKRHRQGGPLAPRGVGPNYGRQEAEAPLVFRLVQNSRLVRTLVQQIAESKMQSEAI